MVSGVEITNAPECYICNIKFEEMEDLNRHDKSEHTREEYSCEVCAENICEKCDMGAHKTNHHVDIDEVRTPELLNVIPDDEWLGETVVDLNDLDSNLKRALENVPDANIVEEYDNDEDFFKSKSEDLQDSKVLDDEVFFCDFTITANQITMEIEQLRETLKENIAKENADKADTNGEEDPENGKQTECTICGLQTKTQLRLTMHMRRNHGQKKLKNLEPKKVKMTTPNIKIPPKRKVSTDKPKHTNKFQYQCEQCDFSTKNRYYLPRHRKLIHGKQPKLETVETNMFPATVTRTLSNTSSMKSPPSKITKVDTEAKDSIVERDAKENILTHNAMNQTLENISHDEEIESKKDEQNLLLHNFDNIGDNNEEYFCGKYLSTPNTIPYNENVNAQLAHENNVLKHELKEHNCKKEIEIYKKLHIEFKEGKEDKNNIINTLINDNDKIKEENKTLKIIVRSMDNQNLVEDIVKENERLKSKVTDLQTILTQKNDTIKELMKDLPDIIDTLLNKSSDKSKAEESIWKTIINNHLLDETIRLKAKFEELNKSNDAEKDDDPTTNKELENTYSPIPLVLEEADNNSTNPLELEKANNDSSTPMELEESDKDDSPALPTNLDLEEMVTSDKDTKTNSESCSQTPGGGPQSSPQNESFRKKDKKKTDDFTCSVESPDCPYQCNSIEELATHMRRMHKVNEEATFKCNLCEMSFKVKRELNRHMRENHKNFKPCKSFALNRCEFDEDCIFNHTILQEGHHICYKCGLILTTKTEMIKHIKEIHGSTICHRFLRNQCSFSSKCFYSHTLIPAQNVAITTVTSPAYRPAPSPPTAQDFPDMPTTGPVVRAQERAQPQTLATQVPQVLEQTQQQRQSIEAQVKAALPELIEQLVSLLVTKLTPVNQ